MFFSKAFQLLPVSFHSKIPLYNVNGADAIDKINLNFKILINSCVFSIQRQNNEKHTIRSVQIQVIDRLCFYYTLKKLEFL